MSYKKSYVKSFQIFESIKKNRIEIIRQIIKSYLERYIASPNKLQLEHVYP